MPRINNAHKSVSDQLCNKDLQPLSPSVAETHIGPSLRPPPPILYCVRCNGPFADYENMARTSEHEYWHLDCFVCAQCFKPFEDLQYYDFNGRKYCEQDFQRLFAPCCGRCHQYIIGRYIRAMNKTWHPNCFLCQVCSCPLSDLGFILNKNRVLCHTCNILQKSVTKNRHICVKCKSPIGSDDRSNNDSGQQDEQPLRYKGETYHSYHFNCRTCGIELKPDAREVKGELHCLRCNDKMNKPICGACRRPVEERVVTALGKHWHTEHFACSACEKPFLGKRHFEVKNMAYCERDYYELFGRRCCKCSEILRGNLLCALDRYYCQDHFSCHLCRCQLKANKSKFFDVNSEPCCKKCYKKLPASFRQQLAQQKKLEEKKKKKESIS